MSTLHFHIIQVGHNCQASVKATLASLSRQTYKQWSLTYLDDGSTDPIPKLPVDDMCILCSPLVVILI